MENKKGGSRKTKKELSSSPYFQDEAGYERTLGTTKKYLSMAVKVGCTPLLNGMFCYKKTRQKGCE